MRLREVDGPYFGGAECEGPSDDWQECNIHECPSEIELSFTLFKLPSICLFGEADSLISRDLKQTIFFLIDGSMVSWLSSF